MRNYLTLLPDELVLKKCIVALVIAWNILLCKFIDALVHADTNKFDLITAASTIDTVKTVYTTKRLLKMFDCMSNGMSKS